MVAVTTRLSNQLLSILLSYCLIWNSPAIAATATSDQKILGEIVAAYNRSESLAKFLEAQRSRMGASDYDFLKSKLIGTPDKERPKVILEKNNVISIEHRQGRVQLQVVSSDPFAFRFNNRPLKLPTPVTIQDLWQNLSALMPSQTGQNFIVKGLLPEAQAIPLVVVMIFVAAAAIIIFEGDSNRKVLSTSQNECERVGHGVALKSGSKTQLSESQKRKVEEAIKKYENVVVEQDKQTWTDEDQIKALQRCTMKLEEQGAQVGISMDAAADAAIGTK